jgi:hypothetical protein
LSTISLLVVSCNNSNTDENIYGNWKGIYNDHEISFVFKSDSTCVFNFFDQKSNKFITINGIYELDFSKKPIPLSIRKVPQLNNPLFTIIELINVDSIRIAEFSPKWRLRPISFENGKTINLIRINSENLN